MATPYNSGRLHRGGYTTFGPGRAQPGGRPVNQRAYRHRHRDEGLQLLLNASAWYDLRDLTSSTQQTLPNRANPSADPAQSGSTSGSDTNDPVRLPHSGTNYVYLPGGSLSNTVSVSSTDYTGQTLLSIRVRRPLTPTITDSTYIQSSSASGTARWHARITAAGAISCHTTNDADGTQVTTTLGTVAEVLTARWLRWDFDFAANAVSAYYSNDETRDDTAVSWTQVGSTVVVASTIRAVTTSVTTIGGNSGTGTLAAVDRYVVRNASAAALIVIDTATETLGHNSWTCTTGQTVTVNRATSGLTTAVVTRPLAMSDGTDDYIQLPAEDAPSGLPAAMTVLSVIRWFSTGTGSSLRVWSSESSISSGIALSVPSGNVELAVIGSGGSVFPTQAPVTPNALRAVGGVIDGSSAYAYDSQTGLSAASSLASVGAVVNAAPRLGVRGYSVGLPLRAELYASAYWARALTATELDAASAYLLGSYA